MQQLNLLRIYSVYYHLQDIQNCVDEENKRFRLEKELCLGSNIPDSVKHAAKIEEIYSTAPITSKLRFVLDFLKCATEPILVFSEYKIPLHVFARHLGNIPYAIITGECNRTKREKELLRFRNGECNILFLSKSAGGVGLNLERASKCIFLDTAWDPQKETQAIGRMDRRTQKAKKLFVSHVVVAGSFDCVRYAVHASKSRHLESALGRGEIVEGDNINPIYSSVCLERFEKLYRKWKRISKLDSTQLNKSMMMNQIEKESFADEMKSSRKRAHDDETHSTDSECSSYASDDDSFIDNRSHIESDNESDNDNGDNDNSDNDNSDMESIRIVDANHINHTINHNSNIQEIGFKKFRRVILDDDDDDANMQSV